MRQRLEHADRWSKDAQRIQTDQLRWLLFCAVNTQFGQRHCFEQLLRDKDPYPLFCSLVPLHDYEDIRPSVMKMVEGERDILWPGYCTDFAQSSGTSGGRSKYIPITRDSLRINHYAGAATSAALYLREYPDSNLFGGKALILGGSFDSELHPSNHKVKVGDLSATLIHRVNPLINLFRIPDKKTALMADWHEKLDAIARKAVKANITNLSGVPSWMLTLLRRCMEIAGTDNIREIWPNLEVFFHGGISFAPYRDEYKAISGGNPINYFENYNASEGFFASQLHRDDPAMVLHLDTGVFYEFIPLGKDTDAKPLTISQVEVGKVYELVVSSCNGLWRYRIGDTVRVVDTDPVKIVVAGRTKSFINAFGEELMEDNANKAIEMASRDCNAAIRNYTAAPQYAHDGHRGRHRWLIEWTREPQDLQKFAVCLDSHLREVNSDYAAKREGDIFLALPEVITAPQGTFDRWLSQAGNKKLGGQRKIPRLHNTPEIFNQLLKAKDEAKME